MPAPARVPLGASTKNGKWFVDVDTSTTGTPNWVGVFGMTDFQLKFDSNLEDDTDFDSGGFGSQTKTGESWSLEMKLARKTQAALLTAYDPGQEFLRGRAIAKMGPANSVHVRTYEMEPNGPRVEAYEGRAAVTWEPEGGKVTDLSAVKVALAGQGKLTAITHPDV